MGPDLVKRLIDRSAGHAPRRRSTRLTGRPTRALVDPWAPGGREYEHQAAAAEATEWHAIMASLGPVPVEPDPDAERWVAARTAADLAANATDDPENDPAAEPPEPEWVQHLDGLAPGPDLARVLAGLDPTTLDEAALVEMTAAAQRQGAWSHALAARAAAELAGRATMTPHWNPAAGPAPRAANVAPDELVMRLCCSRRTATTLIAQGQAFSGALVATGEALAAGEIDPIRARVLTDRLALVPGEVAWQVEDRVLADADRRSLTEFRRDVERALLEVDPTDAHERHERARTTRRVDRPRVGRALGRAPRPASHPHPPPSGCLRPHRPERRRRPHPGPPPRRRTLRPPPPPHHRAHPRHHRCHRCRHHGDRHPHHPRRHHSNRHPHHR